MMSGSTAKVISASRQFMFSMMPTMPASTNTSSKIETTPGGEHLVQRVHVGGDPRDQSADGVLVEEADVHVLQVAEDLAAQIEHDLLAGPLHGVGLDKFQREREYKKTDVKATDLRDAG